MMGRMFDEVCRLVVIDGCRDDWSFGERICNRT